MEPRHLPLLMMLLFLAFVVLARVGIQFALVGDSGIRSGHKLRTSWEISISYLMFGTVVVQLVLSWLYAETLIRQHIELGSASTWIGVMLCIIGMHIRQLLSVRYGKKLENGCRPG